MGRSGPVRFVDHLPDPPPSPTPRRRSLEPQDLLQPPTLYPSSLANIPTHNPPTSPLHTDPSAPAPTYSYPSTTLRPPPLTSDAEGTTSRDPAPPPREPSGTAAPPATPTPPPNPTKTRKRQRRRAAELAAWRCQQQVEYDSHPIQSFYDPSPRKRRKRRKSSPTLSVNVNPGNIPPPSPEPDFFLSDYEPNSPTTTLDPP
mmetsp:Transcript_23595/g.66216  ORF Transcript_23595/g.66216 Transcript_23595/m.66216 type:complete len:201 (+) Transcript_23595:216-818(+)|eukprot:CAMPEP_0119127072 /NCGR_PEP_ID=MMETSP1310-20130426/5756_1 /TAXON_ID=464262 /ORGANISM="Genus nov. species nov., Strain RCC2339" /LENGTH=200 /DNA_ID=CAMNT_0007117293 /DNA_START=193 /DNA_END=795 /DNA_ORIENTATION=-